MDSGSITSIASSNIDYLKTFTCGFDLSSASGLELAFDERQKADFLSNRFKTEHYDIVLKAGDMERVMDKLIWHLEDPRVGQSYPNYYVSKLASKFVKVVLSGAGGDELFAGYPWRYYNSIDPEGISEYVENYYGYWQRLIPDRDKNKFFLRKNINGLDNKSSKNIFKKVFNEQLLKDRSSENNINQSLYFESKTFLHGLLIVEDKLSMANSLETRVPFLDNDLVDFAMKVPIKFKLKNISPKTIIDENEPGRRTGGTPGQGRSVVVGGREECGIAGREGFGRCGRCGRGGRGNKCIVVVAGLTNVANATDGLRVRHEVETVAGGVCQSWQKRPRHLPSVWSG